MLVPALGARPCVPDFRRHHFDRGAQQPQQHIAVEHHRLPMAPATRKMPSMGSETNSRPSRARRIIEGLDGLLIIGARSRPTRLLVS